MCLCPHRPLRAPRRRLCVQTPMRRELRARRITRAEKDRRRRLKNGLKAQIRAPGADSPTSVLAWSVDRGAGGVAVARPSAVHCGASLELGPAGNESDGVDTHCGSRRLRIGVSASAGHRSPADGPPLDRI